MEPRADRVRLLLEDGEVVSVEPDLDRLARRSESPLREDQGHGVRHDAHALAPPGQDVVDAARPPLGGEEIQRDRGEVRALVLGVPVLVEADGDAAHQPFAARLARRKLLVHGLGGPCDAFDDPLRARERCPGRKQDAADGDVAVERREGLELEMTARQHADGREEHSDRESHGAIPPAHGGVDETADDVLAHPAQSGVEAPAESASSGRARATSGVRQVVREDQERFHQADRQDQDEDDGHDPQHRRRSGPRGRPTA